MFNKSSCRSDVSRSVAQTLNNRVCLEGWNRQERFDRRDSGMPCRRPLKLVNADVKLPRSQDAVDAL